MMRWHLWIMVAVTLTWVRAGEPAALGRMLDATVFVGSGSGVLVSRSGLVLTNHHVVAGLAPVGVRTRDGRTYPAEILGLDVVGDLALLRLPEREGGWPAAAWADAGDLRQGAAVVAVGNPFALGDHDDRMSLSWGILSTGRVVRGAYADCVCTDAAVNPGNSGGGLFLADGRLAGINGMIRTRTGLRANSRIGLAIAVSALRRWLPVLESAEGGLVFRTALPPGLECVDGEAGPVVRLPLPPLLAEDRILRLDGRPVASVDSLRGLGTVLPWSPGATIDIEVRRAGSTTTLALALVRHPIPGQPEWPIEVVERDGQALLSAVADNTAAWRAGMRAGERIARVDGQSIAGHGDWLRLRAGKAVGDRVQLVVLATDGSQRSANWQLGLAP